MVAASENRKRNKRIRLILNEVSDGEGSNARQYFDEFKAQ